MPIWVSVQGGEQIRDLSKRLKDAGRGDLQKELRRQIRRAGRPVVADVRGAAKRVQVSSSKGGRARPDKSTGLRDRVARATMLSATQTGVRIRVSARRFGEYGATLPRYLDREAARKPWRHPVFGNREAWVTQSGEPYFYATIRQHAKRFRRACFDAMDDTARELTS